MKSRWSAFLVGLTAQIVFSATFLGLPAASILFQRALQLDMSELAVFLGSASIAVVVTEAPWGMAADRFGERRVLLAGIGITVLALTGLGIASSLSVTPPLWVLALLLFVAAGAGGAVTGPSGSAILGWFDARRHATLVTLRVASVPVGGALGTVAYAILLEALGVVGTFIAAASACALVGALVALLSFDPPRGHDSDGPPSGVLSDPRVWRVAITGFLLDVSQFLVLTFAATVLHQLFSVPVAVGLTWVTVMQLLGGALRVLAGVGTDFLPWLSRARVVRGLGLVQVMCLAPFLCGTALPVHLGIALMVIAGIAGCAWQGAHFSHMAILAGPGGAGAALGLNNTATSLGAFTAQVMAGTCVVAFDWPVTVLLLGALPAFLASLLFPGDSVERAPR
ncbi:MFS transporter [Microbacterium sp. NPDC089321]|uniref:MFS transporter n=1 Tax=Microbacterium sp. NPDC089321 TaxID=3155183 RepID=UPI00342C2BC3